MCLLRLNGVDTKVFDTLTISYSRLSSSRLSVFHFHGIESLLIPCYKIIPNLTISEQAAENTLYPHTQKNKKTLYSDRPKRDYPSTTVI